MAVPVIRVDRGGRIDRERRASLVWTASTTTEETVVVVVCRSARARTEWRNDGGVARSHRETVTGECVRPTVVEESLARGVDEGAVGVDDDAARGRACGDLAGDRIALVVGGVEIACRPRLFRGRRW